MFADNLILGYIFEKKRTEHSKRKDKWFLLNIMVNQNKIFSFKIKGQGKNFFPSDVKRTVHYENTPIQIY